MEVINIKEKFKKFSDHYNPRIAAELNGQHVKFAKLKGDFIWHSHKDEDEMFLVIKGRLFMDLRERTLTLDEGDMLVIPKGTEHRPRADEEVHVILFEPAQTLNTGDVRHSFTRDNPDWI
ncbi:MAG TPA: cupin domain-containing protein [Ignavibacteria bacterium]|nr:cupin domain-containing protein [Ignavibacteria bacterium]HMR40650.1 cupin domain-containing protein [Ignavibacteria bacterium]